MKSLFAKILIWFVAMAVFTAVGAAVVAALGNPPEGRNPWPGLLMQFIADEAQRGYREGGRKELRSYLQRMRDIALLEGHLVDSSGVDLIDGEDRGAPLRQAQRSLLPMTRDGGRMLIARASSDQQAYLLLYPPSRAAFPLLIPQQVWVLACVVLFSYLLARHLTDPLRRVAAAAQRFGAGDLTSRAPVERKDEVGQLAASFNRMADQIQELVQRQQRLLLDVSHELRSPLARLNVAVELGRLDVIQQQAERLNALVGSLLQVSRAEADPGQLRREPASLRALVQQVLEAATLEAHAAQVSLHFPEGSDATLDADAELLARAIDNIVRNAIRYSPAGGVVEVSLEDARLTIRDFGPGVPEESLPQLFDPFYRVEGQQGKGTGLGLSIAQRAVTLHGGSIRAENANPGLRVIVELPQRG